jgi:hypothetical protein
LAEGRLGPATDRFGALFLAALRASGGTGAHAEAARRVVLTILLAEALAASSWEPGADGGVGRGPLRAPRRARPRRQRLPQHGSLAGRRPRG